MTSLYDISETLCLQQLRFCYYNNQQYIFVSLIDLECKQNSTNVDHN